jgi:hypothetical protein
VKRQRTVRVQVSHPATASAWSCGSCEYQTAVRPVHGGRYLGSVTLSTRHLQPASAASNPPRVATTTFAYGGAGAPERFRSSGIDRAPRLYACACTRGRADDRRRPIALRAPRARRPQRSRDRIRARRGGLPWRREGRVHGHYPSPRRGSDRAVGWPALGPAPGMPPGDPVGALDPEIPADPATPRAEGFSGPATARPGADHAAVPVVLRSPVACRPELAPNRA